MAGFCREQVGQDRRRGRDFFAPKSNLAQNHKPVIRMTRRMSGRWALWQRPIAKS
jgi:hypothetical protein